MRFFFSLPCPCACSHSRSHALSFHLPIHPSISELFPAALATLARQPALALHRVPHPRYGGANLLPLERGIDQAADEDSPDDAEAGKRPVALFEDGDERRHDVFLSTGGRGARELRLVV
jgi:hypothetical protein